MSAKLIAAGVLALAFAGLGAWGYVGHADAKLNAAKLETVKKERDAAAAALKAVEAERTRIAAVSDERQKKINELQAKSAAQQKALNDALKANREWADAAVPDSVWDALGAPADARPQQARPRVDAGSR